MGQKLGQNATPAGGPVISTQRRQNFAILSANHLTVEPEKWGLKVAARRGFLKKDFGVTKSILKKPRLAATFRPHVSGPTVR